MQSTVRSQSYFCWLYRTSPSLAAKNIIYLISVLTIWWCPYVESSLVLIGRGCLLWLVHSLGRTLLAFCPASFCTPTLNLSVIPGVSWLPTFALLSPIMKRTSSLGVSSRRSYRSSQNCSTSASSALSKGMILDYYVLIVRRNYFQYYRIQYLPSHRLNTASG